MSSHAHVKNVALVGGSGLVGGSVLRYMLAAGLETFNITVITRSDSTATFPSHPNLKLAKGSYTDTEFLESTLRGQEVLILTFHVRTPPETQFAFIRAAANTGVPWIVPNEWGCDGFNKPLADSVIIVGKNQQYRDLIEELGKSKWVGMATGLWIDFGLMPKTSHLGIWIKDRKALLVDDGNTPITLSTIPQSGHAVANVLKLPITTPPGGGPSLSDYANNYVYLRSVSVSLNEILASVQRATGTKPEEWTVTHVPADEYIAKGHEMLKGGNHFGLVNVLYGSVFKKGFGNQFFGRELANEKLGLKDEDLDEIIKRVLEEYETASQ